jgi:hypothetical protein
MSTRAAALNRAFNNTDATVAAFAATVADLTANEIAAANKFDVATLTDAALAKQVMTNMGFLPSTVAAITQLETELAAYFGGMGKGNRGFVVLQLSNILTGLTADATYGAIATAWNAEIAASVVQSVPGTFALTTVATDNLVGGAGDDIFTGVSALLSSVNTLSATDKINGGAGNDVFKLSMVKGNSTLTTGSISGVETVEITNDSENTLAFDATNVTGVTTYTFNEATGPVTVTNAGTGVKTINLNNQGKVAGATAATTFSFAYAADAAERATAATADAITLNLSSVGGSSTSTKKATVTVDSIESVTVNLTGTNYADVGGSTLSKLTVTGSGTNNFRSVPSTLTSYDASSATGNITAVLTASTSTITKVAGGSGNDTITYQEQDGSAIATLSGGTGTDTLTLASDGGIVEYTMTGFETLGLGTVSSALTLSGAKSTDIATVSVGEAVSAVVTLASMGAGNLTFTSTGTTVDGSGDTAADIISDHTGTATVNYVANLGDATGSDLPAGDFSFSGSTGALTVSVGAYTDTSSSTITSAANTSAIITVDSGLNTAGTSEITQFNSVITANKAKSLTVNATGKLGTSAGFSSTGMTSATITNGATAGEFDLTGTSLASLNVTTGNTLDLSGGGTLSGLEGVTIATSKGVVTLGTLAKANSLTLSGAGTTSSVILGDLGAANAADFAMTATGLKAGLNNSAATGFTIDVAKGFDINIDVSGTTGTVKFGNVGSLASNAPDDISITANKATGAFTVGSVLGTGNVTVKASGSTSASTIGSVGGDVVVVDISSTGTGSDMGTVTAKTSANVTYSAIEQTNETIQAGSGSTALTIAVKTGVQADTLTITGVSSQTGITMTGDLGASTDQVNLTSNLSASAQTISLSGLLNYDASTIVSGSGADTISGGLGADVITGGRGADSLTGGGGADVFRFNGGESGATAFDTITDLGSTDQIWFGGAQVAMLGTTAGTTTAADVNSLGVANFLTMTTAPTTLSGAATAVDLATADVAGKAVMFTFSGSTYMFIDSGSTDAADVVIKLTGIALPTSALTIGSTGSLTGVYGLGS